MDSNNNYPPNPYSYNPSYGYDHVPASPNPYPPPNSCAQLAHPPPVSSPYPHAQYSHYPTPYSSFYTGAVNSHPYQHHGYPNPPPSAPPRPSLHTFGSFPHGSFHYPHHELSGSGRLHPADVQFNDLPRASSEYSSLHYYSHSSSSVAGSVKNYVLPHGSTTNNSPLYPPVDDVMGNMNLSDDHNNPSAPASLPATASSSVACPPPKYHSGPMPMTNNIHGTGTIYGYPNSSASSWELASTSHVESPSIPASPHTPTHTNMPFNTSMQPVQVSSPKASLKVLLLHGNLDIWVYEAKNLPNMDMFHKTIGDMFDKLPGNLTSKIEGQISHQITSDPYVSIMITGATIGRTYVLSNSENPVWNQNFIVPVAHYAAEVHFVVKDNDIVGSQHIGTVSIPL